MLMQMSARMIKNTDKRLLWKFVYNFCWKGMRSVQRFKKRLKKGVVFPPFLYISVTNACNLRCQGCWVDVDKEQEVIDLERMNKMINEAKSHGNTFYGILGGEPFMHPQLLDICAAHPDCYFQIFTNGQFITKEVAKKIREVGNVTPLISIEGMEIASDERRGRLQVLNKTLRGLDNCLEEKIITGVATSLAQNNIDDLLTEAWIDKLTERGVHYVWYYTYRPIGPKPTTELALTPEQIVRARQFMVDMRCKKPIGIVDAYWNDKGEALCPAATGISHHISPWGDIEPCPIVQFAKEKIDDERGIYTTMTESSYLADFRELAAKTTRGCIVLEKPQLLKQFVEKHGAGDTTVRETAHAELEALGEGRHSQHLPGQEIPEKHWLYRFAKKHWFFGFGAYS